MQMLHAITWGRFFTAVLLSTAAYYSILFLLFYRNKVFNWLRKKPPLLVAIGLVSSIALQAQDGNQGIGQANTMIRGYYDTGVQLMYAIGAVLALVGAVKTFREWNAGHKEEA